MQTEAKITIPATTLVETILYIAIAAMVMLVISGLAVSLLQARNRNQVISEVTAQAALIAEHFQIVMNSATTITSPTFAATTTSLQVQTASIPANPTILSQVSDYLQVAEGANNYRLSSNLVQLSNLQFTNLGETGTAGSIRMQFTLAYANPNSSNQLDYTQTFYVSRTTK
jgi:hypothetical protein